MAPARVSVIGAGAFGTAMAYHLARAGHDTVLWAREPALVERINATRANEAYLPGVAAPDGLAATADLGDALGRADFAFLVVPTPYIEKTLAPHVDKIKDSCIVVSCSKGILNGTLETVEQLLLRVLPASVHPRLAFLSGPSFAKEVALGLPTMVTVAARDEAVARAAQAALSTPYFRCYHTTDVTGVELGGALKNVLAIACGISDGLQFGQNARAALITRGLAEIATLATALGANPLTLLGLGGIGDVVLTCTGDASRNRTVGLRIGRGEKLSDIAASMGGSHAEGVLTSRSAYDLAKRLGIDCATIEGIYRVLHEGADPVQTVRDNMSRELKHEMPAPLRESLAAGGAAGGAAAGGAHAAPAGAATAAAAAGGAAAAAATLSPLAGELAKLAEGLLYTSESEYPFVPFEWPAADVAAAAASAGADAGTDAAAAVPEAVVRALAKIDPAARCDARGFDAWFGQTARAEEWMDASQRADAARFAAVRDWMRANLTGLSVLRFGRVEVDVVAVGRAASGGVIGFRTIAVET